MTSDTQRFRCFLIGSESLLVQCAETLLQAGHEVGGIISAAEPIEAWAAERQVPVLDPGSDWVTELRREPFDYFFAITHLAMIPEEVLSLPRELAINFHDGPLPRYAGLNATTWALLAGEAEHGITWHVMTAGADEGDVLVQRRFEVAPGETALTLNTRCYEAAIDSFGELVDGLARGSLARTPQDLSQRSYFGKHDRPDAAAVLDWSRPAEELERLSRALDTGAYANPVAVPRLWTGTGVLVAAHVRALEEASPSAPGTLVSVDAAGWRVATSSEDVLVSRFATPDGTALGPEAAREHAGVETGSVLPPLSAEQRARLNAEAEGLARAEGLWTRRLERLDPVELPYGRSGAAVGEADWVRRGVSLVSDNVATAVAGVLAYLARVGGKHEFHLDYRDPELGARTAGLEAFVASHVPWRARLREAVTAAAWVDEVERELTRQGRRGSYFRDVALRFPVLAERGPRDGARLPVALELVDDPAGFQPRAGAPFTVALAADGRRAELVADAAGYDEQALEAIAGQLATFVAALAEHPERPVAELSLLSEAESERVLRTWNATALDHDRGRCVHELFEAQVERSPDAPALAFEDEALSYRELNERANRLAHHLRHLGVGPEVLVGVCIDRSVDMLVSILAVQKAGGAYVPLDPGFPADRIALMIEDSQVALILTHTSKRASLPAEGFECVCVDQLDAALADASVANPESGVRPENLAYVIYTSGSTGRPKGVLVEHRNVVNFFHGMDECIEHDPPGVWLAVTSLSFDISVLELFWTLARGFKVVLYADRAREVAASQAGRAHADKPIDMSFFYFASDEGENAADKYALLLEGAKFADQRGFNAVWTPERHFHSFGGLYPNPAVSSAAVAAVTENIRIRSGSVVLPLHHPVRVAEEWAVVDNLSHGRVDLSFAAGWQPNDFVLRPENFADAKQAMFRDIEVVRELWRGETRTFPGPKGDVEVRTMPRPVQPELPVWITTAGNVETYEMAAERGFHILTHLLGQTLEQLAEKIEAYRKRWRECGHPGQGQISLMLHTFVWPDEEFVREQARGPMKEYLRSSVGLIKEAAWTFPTFQKMQAESGQSPEEIFEGGLSEEEMEALLEHAFQRYYRTSSLIGTPEQCVAMVDRLKGIGVDEVACQIDFGVPGDVVLQSLEFLDEVRRASTPSDRDAESADHSLPALLERHAVTHLQCTPSMAQMLTLSDEARGKLKGLRQFLVGGEAFPLALARELAKETDASLVNMYGPTETTIWSATHDVDPSAGGIPIGRPIANTELYVVDAQLRPQPVGVPGELLIGGEGVVRGYHERPELTRDRFVPDPFSGRPEARLYRTGDLVRYRSDGTLEFLGRIDHQVKIRGYRIELGEIETLLNLHPDVREAVVVVREDTPGDKRLVAYFIAHAGTRVEADALRSALREKLPEYMVPSHFVPLARFPLTPNAKVDRKALPAPEAAQPRRTVKPPENELQESIAAVWRDALGVDEVGLDDNFFDLGGHSLLAVRVHRTLRERLDRPLSITDLFRLPTIRALGEFLSGDGDNEALARKTEDRAEARKEAMARRRQRRRGRS
ncbi:MAG: LLM class flavin-dependent oxidoreductase [Proteobacteria bacterium]|nr:LLM class flavin-dependent oxidoreductase [Pseudomonadota bacterium]